MYMIKKTNIHIGIETLSPYKVSIVFPSVLWKLWTLCFKILMLIMIVTKKSMI